MIKKLFVYFQKRMEDVSYKPMDYLVESQISIVSIYNTLLSSGNQKIQLEIPKELNNMMIHLVKEKYKYLYEKQLIIISDTPKYNQLFLDCLYFIYYYSKACNVLDAYPLTISDIEQLNKIMLDLQVHYTNVSDSFIVKSYEIFLCIFCQSKRFYEKNEIYTRLSNEIVQTERSDVNSSIIPNLLILLGQN